ncbi:efflux RND transporter periplasmic adaptor subunit [Ancylobacter terrae]|uniref:efflux RND transporter periplasmic adaptor subunit n=1 Tax=Ancylobacter sp. sgz301288 TaxID=3342077 RepID=UPI003858D217
MSLAHSRPAFRFAPVIILGLLAAGCGQEQPKQAQPAPPPPPVTVALPIKKTVTDYDEYVGRFVAIDTVNVYARVSGYLDSINFRDGQTVKQGDLLFTIDKRPFQVALEQAQANLAKAQADLDFATSDLQRAQTLLQDRTSTAISKQAFDQRQQTERSARASVAAADAQMRAAQLDLDFTQLHSPVNGRIGDRRASVGNLVTGGAGGANTNTLLATIVSIDPIYFEFTVDEAAYIRYQKLGIARKPSQVVGSSIDPIPVRLRLLGETSFDHNGVMDFVDNALQLTTGTIRARAKFDNPNGLFTPGMFGRVEVPASPPHEALLVPDVAIGTEQTRKFVYVMGPGSEPQAPQIKYVTLGRLQGDLRIITDGIGPDDRVVVNGMVRIRPGAKVVAQEAAPPAAAPASGAPAPAPAGGAPANGAPAPAPANSAPASTPAGGAAPAAPASGSPAAAPAGGAGSGGSAPAKTN